MEIVLLVIVLFALLSFGYAAYRQWWTHGQRRVAAEANGWRYQPKGWQSWVINEYSIVGSTPNGIIWELKRVRNGDNFYFSWKTENAKFAHGFLQIRPRLSVQHANLADDLIKHQVQNLGSEKWRGTYVVFTTHQFSVPKYMTPELQEAMLCWPEWSEPGALEFVHWQGHVLEINGRYQDDWQNIERLVALGTLLTAKNKETPLAARQ